MRRRRARSVSAAIRVSLLKVDVCTRLVSSSESKGNSKDPDGPPSLTPGQGRRFLRDMREATEDRVGCGAVAAFWATVAVIVFLYVWRHPSPVDAPAPAPYPSTHWDSLPYEPGAM